MPFRSPRSLPARMGYRSARRALKARSSRAARTGALAVARTPASRNVRTAGFLGIEKKYFDLFQADYAVTHASGPVSPCGGALNCPAVGNGPTERNGSKATMKSVIVRGTLTQRYSTSTTVPTSTFVPQVVTCMLVLDKQTNASTPTGTDILQNAIDLPVGATDEEQLAAMRFANIENSDRFVILKRKTITLTRQMIPAYSIAGNPDVVPITSTAQYHMEPVLKRFELAWNGDIETHFTKTGSASSIASISKNSILFLCVAEERSAEAYNLVYCSYRSRCRFVG